MELQLYMYLENSQKKICELIGFKLCFYNSIQNTQLAQAVDVMMAWEKRIHILIIKVNNLISFLLRNFLKWTEHTSSLHLLTYRNTFESLGELVKTMETLACWLRFPQHFSFSQTSTRVSTCITQYMFSFNFLKKRKGWSYIGISRGGFKWKKKKLILLWKNTLFMACNETPKI